MFIHNIFSHFKLKHRCIFFVFYFKTKTGRVTPEIGATNCLKIQRIFLFFSLFLLSKQRFSGCVQPHPEILTTYNIMKIPLITWVFGHQLNNANTGNEPGHVTVSVPHYVTEGIKLSAGCCFFLLHWFEKKTCFKFHFGFSYCPLAWYELEMWSLSMPAAPSFPMLISLENFWSLTSPTS